MGVREVLARPEDRVVLEESVEDVDGLTGRARDRPRREDRVLVRDVRIYRDGPLIKTKVARIKGGQQRTRVNPETLTV